MEKEDALKEIKYELGKFIFKLLETEGILSHEQFLNLRDALIDRYTPIIGELERGSDYEYPKN